MITGLADWLGTLNLSWTNVLMGLGLFLASMAISLLVVGFVLVKLPVDYFRDNHHPAAFAWADRHPALRWTVLIVKNAIGLQIIVLGILLSLPGIPGQGFLTILIGLMLVNFPGKRRLERWIISRPKVLQAVNALRARYGKPPLILDDEDGIRPRHLHPGSSTAGDQVESSGSDLPHSPVR